MQTLRRLFKAPGFALATILTLALGIGATTAIFSVVYAVLLQPLPFPKSGQLVDLRAAKLPEFADFQVSPGDFIAWEESLTKPDGVFSAAAAVSGGIFNLADPGEPQRLAGSYVTAGFFDVLGIQPALGRTFTRAEMLPAAGRVAIISHRLWQETFGGRTDILGRSLRINEKPCTVVGVMPEGFGWPSRQKSIWMPATAVEEQRGDHDSHYLRTIARLRDGVSLEQASAALALTARQLEQEFPQTNSGWTAHLRTLQETQSAPLRPALLLLFAIVGIALLMSCANAVNLLLNRAITRQRELAVRAALGASRGQMMRMLLGESVLLAALGGAAGCLLAYWGVAGLRAVTPSELSILREASVNLPVLGFAFGLALVSGVLCGLLPAWQGAEQESNLALHFGGRNATASPRQRHLRTLLVTAEFALALPVLVGAGLLTTSFRNILQKGAGFEPNHAMTALVARPTQVLTMGTDSAESVRDADFFRRLVDGAAALTGVQAAGVSQFLPLVSDWVNAFTIDGAPPLKVGETLTSNYFAISEDYFRAMGIRLVRGRTFTRADSAQAPRVAIVSETFARRYFGTTDPIGQRLHIMSPESPAAEIVGLVADVAEYRLTSAPPPQMYQPFEQQPFPTMGIVLRTAPGLDPLSLSAPLRALARKLDPAQPVSDVAPLGRIIDDALARERFTLALIDGLGALALLLAAFGIYSAVAYTVTQRTGEFGIRIALGASPRHIARAVFQDGLRPLAFALPLGLGLTWAVGGLLRGMVFGVGVFHPLTVAGGIILLLLTVVAACWIPARRALSVDPVVALRAE